jgi:pimeloyl-ACP methyl ester carboxylesterase
MVNTDLPFKSHYLDRDGLQYHYIDEGTGPPVVMLHGNPTWSFYYRNLVNTLKPDFRCIVPDHIGCGLSDKPGDDRYEYTLDRRVDDLEKLLAHLEISENITLIVHDWGGMIGMAYAVRHPEQIARFVIMNTSGFLLPADKKLPLGLKLCRSRLTGPLLVRGLNAFCRGAARVGTKRTPLSRELRRAYCRPYNSWANRIAILRFVQDIPLVSSDRSYATVSNVDAGLGQFKDSPMLLCWGMRDFVFDHHFLDEWERRMPGAEVHRFEDCGHYILEDGGEEILNIISDFLKADRPAAGG